MRSGEWDSQCLGGKTKTVMTTLNESNLAQSVGCANGRMRPSSLVLCAEAPLIVVLRANTGHSCTLLVTDSERRQKRFAPWQMLIFGWGGASTGHRCEDGSKLMSTPPFSQ